MEFGLHILRELQTRKMGHERSPREALCGGAAVLPVEPKVALEQDRQRALCSRRAVHGCGRPEDQYLDRPARVLFLYRVLPVAIPIGRILVLVSQRGVLHRARESHCKGVRSHPVGIEIHIDRDGVAWNIGIARRLCTLTRDAWRLRHQESNRNPCRRAENARFRREVRPCQRERLRDHKVVDDLCLLPLGFIKQSLDADRGLGQWRQQTSGQRQQRAGRVRTAARAERRARQGKQRGFRARVCSAALRIY